MSIEWRSKRYVRPVHRRLTALLGALGLCSANPAEAGPADSSSSGAGLCANVATQHARQSERLHASRGFTLSRRSEVGFAEAARTLAARISAKDYPASARLLVYSRSKDGLVACLIGPDGSVTGSEAVVSEAELTNAAEAVRSALRVDQLSLTRAARRRSAAQPAPKPAASAPDAKAALRNLSTMLFPAPIAATLSLTELLIVVPTGPIGTMPLPALSLPGRRDQLIDRTSIGIAASLSSFVGETGQWRPAEAFSRPLIVGDPSIPFSPEWLVPPLPGAQAEAMAVARQLKANALTGDAARKEEVVSRAQAATMLFLATHGTSDPGRPLDGGFLMFAGPTFQQGWWTAREVQNARLNAELAILSACQTGLGQTHEGGTIGLARAFQLAGVPRVVMSLWSVDDEATRFLMTRFVQQLSSYPPAEALRRAMLASRAKYRDPAVWAPFLLFGQPN